MTDFAAALGKVIYDRLAAQVSLAGVYQHVPENTQPPVVIVGDMDFENDGDKAGALFRYSVQIVAVIQGPSRKPLNALMTQVFDALNEWTPAATASVRFGPATVETGSGQEIQGEQGPVYFGQQQAVLYVQAA